MLYVDNVDTHCERARAADPEGYPWWFSQRVRG